MALIAEDVDRLRQFSRFYTRKIGALSGTLLDSPHSLPEMRVLFELAHQEEPTVTSLADELGLDRGYLSRLVGNLTTQGLVESQPGSDRRRKVLALTDVGRPAVAQLEQRSSRQMEAFISHLKGQQRSQLVAAADTIERLLGDEPQTGPVVLRPHRPGDIGWLIERHAVLYTEEYGWNEHFEALVAGVAAEFLKGADRERECCWIAERRGDRLGCAMVMKGDDPALAKLRLVLVEPHARGLGLGRQLVDQCIVFARMAGYRRMTLWTNDCLAAARALYQSLGFELVASEPHNMFGPPMVGETWECDL